MFRENQWERMETGISLDMRCVYGVCRLSGGLLLCLWERFGLLYDGEWMKPCKIWERGMGLIKGFWVEFLPFYSRVPDGEFWWKQWRKSKERTGKGSILASLTSSDCSVIRNESRSSLESFLGMRWLLYPEKLIKLWFFSGYQCCTVPAQRLPESSWYHSSWWCLLLCFLGGLLALIL